jgi:hypothetical protein
MITFLYDSKQQVFAFYPSRHNAEKGWTGTVRMRMDQSQCPRHNAKEMLNGPIRSR